MKAGDTKSYYHGMLDKTFKVQIVSVNKNRVSFKYLNGPMSGERRSMTLKQAERGHGW